MRGGCALVEMQRHACNMAHTMTELTHNRRPSVAGRVKADKNAKVEPLSHDLHIGKHHEEAGFLAHRVGRPHAGVHQLALARIGP